MEYVIDLNVVLDVLMDRKPFVDDSYCVLKACQDHRIKGYISANNVVTLFNILHKTLHSTEKTYDAISRLLSIVKLIPLMSFTVLEAVQIRAKDFEDCLLVLSAKNCKCDGIITRNKNDFKDFDINIISPEDFVRKYNNTNND